MKLDSSPTKRLECPDLFGVGAILLAAIVGLVVSLAVPSARASSSARTDTPPQCFLVRILEQSGAYPALWVRFCGTGAGGTSPLEEGVSGNGPLVVDGASLVPKDCTRAAPCVILWPKSPQQ